MSRRRYKQGILGGVLIALSLLTHFERVAAQSTKPSGGPSRNNMPSPSKPPLGKENGSEESDRNEINVKNADIAAIVRIFSKKTGRNYILDERVKGKVTMYLPGAIPPSESLKILDSVLALKGFTSVPIGANLWKVVPSKEARQSTIPTVEDGVDPSGSSDHSGASVVTRLIGLKFVGAEEVQQLVSQLVSPDGLVSSYPGTNSLVVIDYEDNIKRIAHLVSELDIPFTDRDMAIIPVKNADAVDIADKLKELLGDSSKKDGDAASDLRARFQGLVSFPPPGGAPNGGLPPGSPGINNGQNRAASAGTGSTATQARAREPKIIADERTNAIIVVGDDDSITRVKALVQQLDTPLDLSGHRFYVYRCQHANAEELSQVLSGLVGGGSGSTTGSTQGGLNRTGGGAFGGESDGGISGRTSSRSRDNRQSRTNSRLSGSSRNPGRSRNEGQQQQTPASVQLGDDISITADPATNSLIINAGKAEYEKILALLQKLDIKRRQVLVEAALLEVSVDDSQVLGTDFLTSTGGKDGGVVAQSNVNGAQGLAGILSDPTKLNNFTLAAASSGSLKIGDTITLPTQAIVLSAAQNNSNVNVLSAPTLLATDNEEAEIVVGQNVPFLASRSSSETNLNNTFNQVDRQDVGITLRITPQISSKDYVTLKIYTEVSSVVAQATTDLGPTTTVRLSETTVITKDGQMIVIGGLISDENNDSKSGVPFLQDVPIIGQVFKRSSTTRNRRNLLTFITPRVIQDQFDAREVTMTHRDALKSAIRQGEAGPTRENLLDSVDIDRVTESNPYEGPKPGTILAPKGYGESKENSARGTAPRGAIQLRVAPKAPELELPSGSTNPSSKDPATNEKQGITPKVSATRNSQGDRYYVMKVVNRADSTGLPFPVSVEGLFGVVIPKESNPMAKTFFQLGKTYKYATGTSGSTTSAKNQVLLAQAVEQYSSEAPIGPIHGFSSSSWYILSPHEIMNLGRGPWHLQ